MDISSGQSLLWNKKKGKPLKMLLNDGQPCGKYRERNESGRQETQKKYDLRTGTLYPNRKSLILTRRDTRLQQQKRTTPLSVHLIEVSKRWAATKEIG